MDWVSQVQILDRAVSFCVNAFGKGMNPFLLLPVKSKELDKLSSLTLIG